MMIAPRYPLLLLISLALPACVDLPDPPATVEGRDMEASDLPHTASDGMSLPDDGIFEDEETDPPASVVTGVTIAAEDSLTLEVDESRTLAVDITTADGSDPALSEVLTYMTSAPEETYLTVTEDMGAFTLTGVSPTPDTTPVTFTVQSMQNQDIKDSLDVVVVEPVLNTLRALPTMVRLDVDNGNLALPFSFKYLSQNGNPIDAADVCDVAGQEPELTAPFEALDNPDVPNGTIGIRYHGVGTHTFRCMANSAGSIPEARVGVIVEGAQKIDAHDAHTCAIHEDRHVRCWGLNDRGQIGDNSQVDALNPVDITNIAKDTLGTAQHISVGAAHSCAVNTDNELYCWGDNRHRQVTGIADGDDLYTTPTRVMSAKRFIDVAAGDTHTCAIDMQGALTCWGTDRAGETGAMTSGPLDAPVTITLSGNTAARFLEVETHTTHTCAIDFEQRTWCWGRNNRGQLGDDGTQDAQTPREVKAPMDTNAPFWRLALGPTHTCALTSADPGLQGGAYAGQVYCWGDNQYGQLGFDPQNVARTPTPMRVNGGQGPALDITTNSTATCMINRAYTSWCWGTGVHGELGVGFSNRDKVLVAPPQEQRTVSFGNFEDTPMRSEMAPPRRAIALGAEHGCLSTGGDGNGPAFFCWGHSANGRTAHGRHGLAALNENMATIPLNSNETRIAAGSNHTCAQGQDRNVPCRGLNHLGQTANADDLRATGENPSSSSGDFGAFFDAGDAFICLTEKNSNMEAILSCKGDNRAGQVGVNIGNDYAKNFRPTSPVKSYRDLSLGASHGCVIEGTQGMAPTLLCWGDNQHGQFQSSPMAARDLDPIKAYEQSVRGMGEVFFVAAGRRSTCIIADSMDTTKDSELLCWGEDARPWSATPNQRPTPTNPVRVSQFGPDQTVHDIVVGDAFGCVLSEESNSSRTVRCWGDNTHGQLGDGSGNSSSSPVVVTLPTQANPTQLTAGRRHVCIRNSNEDAIHCWGDNRLGQIEAPAMRSTPLDTHRFLTPHRIDTQSGLSFENIEAGATHTCAVGTGSSESGVYCWGKNSHGQSGQLTTMRPTELTPFPERVWPMEP